MSGYHLSRFKNQKVLTCYVRYDFSTVYTGPLFLIQIAIRIAQSTCITWSQVWIRIHFWWLSRGGYVMLGLTLSETTFSVSPEETILASTFSLLWACLASLALP